jgi:5-oxopent-3-ene-1,2,5-tricarboxylate decarboxylase/2-hydroxyhepta-2,4-diene-1,7-dioate isomerase
MIAGTVYGVVLNDSALPPQLASAFTEAPYKALPQAPVLYIKSRNCQMTIPGGIPLDADLHEVEVAATLGLLIGRDASRVSHNEALSHISAACLALDVSEPNASFYRPSVRQRCRDGFLPLGLPAPFASKMLDASIDTLINGALVHSWSLSRLVRDAATLITDISEYMTLTAGDLLLIGLPQDAPRASAGDTVRVTCAGLASLTTSFQMEAQT